MKKFFTGTLLSGLILVSVSQATVLAEDEQFSNATVEFTQPDEESAPPEILGPDGEVIEEPGEPDRETGVVTESTGPLTIDYISNFDFGDHEISVAERTYTLESPDQPYVQVSDFRGTGAGWNLTVRASAFQNDGEDSLPGATLSFTNGSVRTNLDGMTELQTPDTFDVTLNTDNTAQNVTTAEQGAGLGSWVTVWDSQNVQLTVPQAAASPGEHTSTLTWTLSDAPGSGGDVEE